MKRVGNVRAAEIYEATLPEGGRPSHDDTTQDFVNDDD
jgi:hypothetical protein